MDEKEQAQAETQEQEPEETQSGDLAKQIEEATGKVKAEIEAQFKSEISGLNRRNSELEKKLDEEAKAKMDEKERIEFEKKQAKEETEAAKKEADEYRVKLIRERLTHEAELSADFVALLRGESEGDIKTEIEGLKKLIAREAEKHLESEYGGKKPTASTGKAVTWAEIQKMTNEEVSNLPDEIVDKAMKN